MAVFERLFSRLTYKMRRRPSFRTGWSDPDNSARSLVTIAIQHRSVDPSIVEMCKQVVRWCMLGAFAYIGPIHRGDVGMNLHVYIYIYNAGLKCMSYMRFHSYNEPWQSAILRVYCIHAGLRLLNHLSTYADSPNLLVLIHYRNCMKDM